tara:strand:+ start:1489 stop:2127 length:639 start_codon:yes stop_codon:yes gene_type:complete
MSREIYNKNANEKALLEEAYSNVYKPKVIEERLVDGKLMCPEACCGEPVMECTCGPKCEHCNCHEIQKLSKEKGISINEAAEIINEVAPMLAAAGRALAPAAKQVGAAAVTGAAAGAHDRAKSMVSGQPSDEEGREMKQPGREFKVGQYVMGIDGMEIVSEIDKNGAVYTLVLTDKGNYYKPGTEEYEELDDYDDYLKYDRMTTYRPAYGEY